MKNSVFIAQSTIQYKYSIQLSYYMRKKIDHFDQQQFINDAYTDMRKYLFHKWNRRFGSYVVDMRIVSEKLRALGK